MISTVVFDFGGVLSRFGGVGDSTRRFATVLGCAAAEVGPKLGPLIDRWNRGELTTVTFWSEAARLMNRPLTDYDAKWQAEEAHSLEPAYYDLARELRAGGYRTAILSDVGPTSAILVRAMGGYRGFDPVILSCEIGCTKRDPAIWRLLCDRLSLPGEAILLIDDMATHLEAATRHGITGILATEPSSTIEAVRAALQAHSA